MIRSILVFCVCSQLLLAQERLAIGDKAPELGLSNLLQAPDKAASDWKSFEGKVVVLEFWATWCGSCLEQIPHWNDIVERLSDHEDVVFLAITFEDPKHVRDQLKSLNRKGWVGLDSKQSAFKAYDPGTVPHAVIVDKKGLIRAITKSKNLSVEAIQKIRRGIPSGLALKKHRRTRKLASQKPERPGKIVATVVPSTGEERKQVKGEWYWQSFGLPLRIILQSALKKSGSEFRCELSGANQIYDVQVLMPKGQGGELEKTVMRTLKNAIHFEIRKEKVKKKVVILERIPNHAGPKISESDQEKLILRGVSLTVTKKTMKPLVDHLSRLTRKNVVDETGLRKLYDYALTCHDKATLIAGLKNLGLRYRTDERDVEITVVANVSSPKLPSEDLK